MLEVLQDDLDDDRNDVDKSSNLSENISIRGDSAVHNFQTVMNETTESVRELGTFESEEDISLNTLPINVRDITAKGKQHNNDTSGWFGKFKKSIGFSQKQSEMQLMNSLTSDKSVGQNNRAAFDAAHSKRSKVNKNDTSDKKPMLDLFLLAKCAAQTRHQWRGYMYDDSPVAVDTETKFSVITISLPLGLLFQENAAGCWVSRIFRSGNAAKTARGDGVEVGDQVVAVNGKSTIGMNMRQVCTMIKSSRNPKAIELTFLRYIGPYRPMPGFSPSKEEKAHFDDETYASFDTFGVKDVK